MTTTTHEFTTEQNFVFRHLASRMRIVGWALMVIGLLVSITAVVAIPRGGSVAGLELALIPLPGRLVEHPGGSRLFPDRDYQRCRCLAPDEGHYRDQKTL